MALLGLIPWKTILAVAAPELIAHLRKRMEGGCPGDGELLSRMAALEASLSGLGRRIRTAFIVALLAATVSAAAVILAVVALVMK